MVGEYKDFGYRDEAPAHTAAYLVPPMMELAGPLGPSVRVLDVGCGNGYIAGLFAKQGCQVVGIDLSEQGLEIGRRTHPTVRFEKLAADADVLRNLGEAPFDLVISTEVVEHLYSPKPYAAGCFAALRPGGRVIMSTPYHGYLKNVVLAVANKYDGHHTPLWDGGHIKFWSRHTLGELLTQSGFVDLKFRGAGRFRYLWMSMLMSGKRPE